MICYGEIFFNLIRQFFIKNRLIFLFSLFNITIVFHAQSNHFQSGESEKNHPIAQNEIYVYGSAFVVNKNVVTNSKIVIVSKLTKTKLEHKILRKGKRKNSIEQIQATQKKKISEKRHHPKPQKIITSSSEDLKSGNALLSKTSVLNNTDFQIKFLLLFSIISISFLGIKKQHDFFEKEFFLLKSHSTFFSIRPPPILL